jgi:hypothetical protein
MSARQGTFEPFANATLTVDLASAPLESIENTGWITDPETGNLIPSTEPVNGVGSPLVRRTYKAHLHEVRSSTLSREAGVNNTSFYLEGMLLEPWQFDSLIQVNQIFEAVYNGLIGKFELLPEQSILPEFKSILGTRLQGIFRLAGAAQTI